MQEHHRWQEHVAEKRAEGQEGDGLLPEDCYKFLQGAVRRARDARKRGQSLLLDAAGSTADRVAVALAMSLQFQNTWFAAAVHRPLGVLYGSDYYWASVASLLDLNADNTSAKALTRLINALCNTASGAEVQMNIYQRDLGNLVKLITFLSENSEADEATILDGLKEFCREGKRHRDHWEGRTSKVKNKVSRPPGRQRDPTPTTDVRSLPRSPPPGAARCRCCCCCCSLRCAARSRSRPG